MATGKVYASREITLTHIHCGGCGVDYAMDEEYRQQRLRDKETWYCPNGCARAYVKSEADRVREELEEARRRAAAAEGQRDRARHEAQSYKNGARALRGHMTRQKKRSAAGVCPCCNRTFQQLARHMKAKHPGYESEEDG